MPADPGVREHRPSGCTTRSATCRSSPRTATSIPECCWTTQPFADPTSLLLQPDHYVTRLLHANGVSLADLGVGEGPLPEPQARQAWRLLCANWHVFRGTPVRYWFDSELGDIFGVTERPSADNADALYDQISAEAGRARLPAPRSARPGSASRCWPPPTTPPTTWPPTRRSPRTRRCRPG